MIGHYHSIIFTIISWVACAHCQTNFNLSSCAPPPANQTIKYTLGVEITNYSSLCVSNNPLTVAITKFNVTNITAVAIAMRRNIQDNTNYGLFSGSPPLSSILCDSKSNILYGWADGLPIVFLQFAWNHNTEDVLSFQDLKLNIIVVTSDLDLFMTFVQIPLCNPPTSPTPPSTKTTQTTSTTPSRTTSNSLNNSASSSVNFLILLCHSLYLIFNLKIFLMF